MHLIWLLIHGTTTLDSRDPSVTRALKENRCISNFCSRHQMISPTSLKLALLLSVCHGIEDHDIGKRKHYLTYVCTEYLTKWEKF